MSEPKALREGHGAKTPAFVQELLRGLGRFERSERSFLHDRRGRIPVLVQRLPAADYSVSFTPGSRVHEVLSNDQNRFALPRALPPILEFVPTADESGEYQIVRYAWSPGAFRLLDSLLQDGHAFDTFEFVELTWQLAQALAFLHSHGVVHGQWNARSVVALPERGSLATLSQHRFELLNTGVGFVSPSAVPEDYVTRGYYPRELFLHRADVPDLGSLDVAGDVYCFAAFLKDLLQRACSTEELPKRATRLMGQLHEHAVRRGWRATAETTRRKELEILDHLYTARARTEYLIQEGLRQGDQRASAETIAKKAETLHRQVVAYLKHLEERGYEPFDAFGGQDGDGLLHYTTFAVTLSPDQIHGLEDSSVEIRGHDLPEELVRVTLNEHSEGIHVADASATRIVLDIDAGLPGGHYSVSINNRRTNASLDVATTEWLDREPQSLHLPWQGCDPADLTVRGFQLPRDVAWSLCPVAGKSVGPKTTSAESIVNLLALGGARDGGLAGGEVRFEVNEDGQADTCQIDAAAPAAPSGVECVSLRIPDDLAPGTYELRVNFLPTPLVFEIRPCLPEPVVQGDALSEDAVRNHRACTLVLTGSDLHPNMLVDFGEDAAPIAVEVVSSSQAKLTLPLGFPAGDYTLHINRAPTDAKLRVEAPEWLAVGPRTLRVGRGQTGPLTVDVTGCALPDPEMGPDGYQLVDRRGRSVDADLLAADAVDDSVVEGASPARDLHRLAISPVIRRGRRRLHFAGRPTGVEIQVRKPTPRSVQVVATAAFVALLTWGGFALVERFRPEITALHQASVFGTLPEDIEIAGRNVDAVELWSNDDVASGLPNGGEPIATLTAIAGEGNAYRIDLPDRLAAGAYRLRPLGSVASDLSPHVLTVRDAELRVEPTVAHRFDDTGFRLLAATGFDVTAFEQAALVPLEGGASRQLPLQAARFALRAADLDGASVGTYAIELDALRLDGVQIQITGPRVIAQPDQPLIPGVGDRVDLDLAIADRGVATWTGLVPMNPVPIEGAATPIALANAAGTVAVATEAVARREAETAADGDVRVEAATFFSAGVAPGRYRIAVGVDGDRAEPIGAPIDVLPRPRIVAVRPTRFAPGRPTRVVVDGVHLTGVEALAIRALGAATAAELPALGVDRAFVQALDDDAFPDAPPGYGQRIEITLTLPSGRYALAATGDVDADSVELAVYDDCLELLGQYRANGADPERLLDCLESERPSDAVLAEAADLLFDRGLFREAGAVLANRADARGLFRRSFVSAFALEQPVNLIPAASLLDAPSYAAAASALGWVLNGGEPAWPDGALPWEVTFVRALKEPDPAVAGSLLARAEQLRAEAAAPVPPRFFAPVDRLRADVLYREITATLGVDAAATGARLRAELIGDDAVWEVLAPEQRTESLFWSAHAAYWYDSDSDLALEHLRLAVGGEGPAAGWATTYLHALGDDTEPAADDGSWPGLFATVLGEFRYVRENPNYDLLSDPDQLPTRRRSSLDPDTIARARALSELMDRLEATPPVDAFAHHVLLYGIRAARAATWPEEYDGSAADRSRQVLEGMPLAESLEPLRRFHLVAADIELLTLAQIVVLPKDQIRERIDELNRLGQDNQLSASLRSRASELAGRLTLPSVVWGNYSKQKNQ